MRKVVIFLKIVKEIIREPNASHTLPYLVYIFVCLVVMEAMLLASIFLR